MAYLSIGTVAAQAGIAASAIRYYEDQGLIPPAARRRGRRVFDHDIFDHLTIIELAQASGFTIAEIRRLKTGLGRKDPPGPRWRALAERKLGAVDDQIRKAQTMKALLATLLGCGCPTLQDCAAAARADPRWRKRTAHDRSK